MRIDLPAHRVDAGAQPARIGVVDRRDDADERLIREVRGLSAIAASAGGVRRVPRAPRGVVDLRIRSGPT